DFGIRKNDVIGPGRGGIDDREKLIPANIFLDTDPNAVALFERADHVGVAMTGPGKNVEFLALELLVLRPRRAMRQDEPRGRARRSSEKGPAVEPAQSLSGRMQKSGHDLLPRNPDARLAVVPVAMIISARELASADP